MDTASLIIGLVMTFVCALPLIYIARSKAKIKKKIKHILETFSLGKFNFKTREMHFKKLYALDEENKGFLFTDLDKEETGTSFIALNEFNSSKIEEVETGTNSKIILYFISSSKNKEIVLYDSDDKTGNAYWLENLQIAKKWQTQIQNCF